MLKIITTGYDGKMGKILADAIREDETLELACVSARGMSSQEGGLKIYDDMSQITESANVVIDFSHPTNLDNILSYALRTKTPLVVATTGYNEDENNKITEASKVIPVFRSYNMALGVNIMLKLVKEATKLLKGFDIEVVEKHHNRKVDAPSGTAVMIAEGIKEVLSDVEFTYGRHGRDAKRQPNEVGIHAIRGGTIVGEHDAIFAGDSEVLTITHQSESRRIFANGSIAAAKFLVNQKPGLYNMDDMLSI
jgi:4-hydroxy-tetrahydrodipicolinate reductase